MDISRYPYPHNLIYINKKVDKEKLNLIYTSILGVDNYLGSGKIINDTTG
jgi:hypothetical protein